MRNKNNFKFNLLYIMKVNFKSLISLSSSFPPSKSGLFSDDSYENIHIKFNEIKFKFITIFSRSYGSR